jgi:para-nitrobenzyl esterase
MATPMHPFQPRRGRRLAALAGALIGLAGATASFAATAAPGAPLDVVQTSRGPVAATLRGAMRSYFAIPYASPPTGERRWRAPEPATPWTTPIARTASADACLQTGRVFRSRADSEDCLYLDVHAPAGPGPYPVMVWIHGGAFTTGDASVYSDPSPLVSKGVIVVALNYRLGAMGFLGIPPCATRMARWATTASWTSRRRCAGCGKTSRPSAATPAT